MKLILSLLLILAMQLYAQPISSFMVMTASAYSSGGGLTSVWN